MGRTLFRLCFLVSISALAAACAGDDGGGGGGGGGAADGGVSGDGRPGAVKPLSYDEVARACVFTAACSFNYQGRVANCVDAYFDIQVPQQLSPIYDAAYRCALRSGGDCAKVLACFGAGKKGGCDRTFKGRCDGTKAVSCDLIDGRVFKLDCAAAGHVCVPPKGSNTFQALCAPGPCTAGSYTANCKGTVLRTCSSAGAIQLDDCALRKLVCSVGRRGGAACRGSGSRCVGDDLPTFSPWCKKLAPTWDHAVTCVGGKTREEDCRKRRFPSTCKNGKCILESDGCKDASNRCKGGKLEACLGGSWRTYDCAALGLGPCETRKVGAACGAR